MRLRHLRLLLLVFLCVLGVGAAVALADTWSSQSSGTTQQLNGASCASMSNCVLDGAGGVILGTSSGGSTWSAQTSGVTSALQAVACPVSADCFAVGSGSTVLATTNSGSSWSAAKITGKATTFSGVACPSTSDCVTVGGAGAIWLTTNGTSWSSQTSGTSNALNGVACPSTSECVAVGASGTILVSTNGGTSWSAKTSGTSNALYGVACPSSSECVAVGASGTILLSSNNGSSWSSQTSGTSNQLTSISCRTTSACWTAGAAGTVLVTTNTGSSWVAQTSGTSNALYGVACVTSTCWAVGASGTIVVDPTAPANTVAPSITGTATAGQTLTAGVGTWSGSAPINYSYQWQDCNSSGTGCTNISGATASTYTLQNTDIGDTVTVAVKATNSSGNATASATPTGVIQAIPPSNTAAPTITGTAKAGQTLTASTGTWAGSTPITYSYQWQDCNASGTGCTNIAAATASTYTLQNTDIGDTIVVSVTSSNTTLAGGGTATAASTATAIVQAIQPSNTSAPATAGTAKDGQTLTASLGTWSGSTPITYSYQWQDCNSSGTACSNISGATSSTYALTSSDVAHTIVVAVTASNASLTGGGTATASTAPTGVVQAVPPSNAAAPAITGTATQGQTLTASTGTWSGSSPIAYSYQWQDCNNSGTSCSNISGATASTYTLGSSDIGDTIVVAVTASNATLPGGGTVPAASTATGVVNAAPPANLTAPSITGTASVSQELTASPGTWSYGPNTYSYQWQDCNASGTGCSNIPGATSPGYIVSSSDYGDTIEVSVTASNQGGSASAESSPTAVVQDQAPVNTAAPAITGTAAVGQTLTASPGSWSGSQPITYRYQWNQCISWYGCQPIPGASGSTYTVGTAPVGQTVEVVVTADNTALPGGGTASATSPATGTVPSIPCSPAISSVSTFTTAKSQAVTFTGTCFGVSPDNSGGGVIFHDLTQGWQGCTNSNVWCYFGPWTNDSVTFSGFGGYYQYFGPSLYNGDHVDIEIPNQQTGAGPSHCIVIIGQAGGATCTLPVNTAAPTITGTAAIGQTLMASPGTWSGSTPMSYSYQWEDCFSGCVPVPGATGDTYAVGSRDVGQTIEVVVTADNSSLPGGGTVNAASVPTATVPSVSCTPSISSVSAFSTVKSQTVTITGTCFGVTGSNAGASGVTFWDQNGGWTGCNNSNVWCYFGSWTNDSITFTGFGGYYQWFGPSLYNGDSLDIEIPNAQTGAGPGQCVVTVGTAAANCLYGTIPLSLRRGCDPSAPGVCDSNGSEVDPGTGDFNHTGTDASVQTYGPPLTFTRTYDSSLAQEQTNDGAPGPLGYGWTDNWATYLTVDPSSNVVTIHQPTGAEVDFAPPVSGSCPTGTSGPGTAGTYCAAPYVTASLAYNSGSKTYTFITHPYESNTFNAAGQLISESGPGGATLTVAYGTPAPGVGLCPSAASSCNTVTSASGRQLVIGSSASGLVTSVTDPRGNTWAYGYCANPGSTCSSDDLVSVTDPLGNVTTYAYDSGNGTASLVHDLVTITNPNGQPGGLNAGAHLTNVYNASGQVTSQTDPDGNQTTSDYSGLNALTGTGNTIVTDPDGNKTAYGYTKGVLTSKTEGSGTPNPSTWTYSPDPNTDLDLSVTDPNHNITSYTYDADGNVTSVIDPLGYQSTYSFNSFDEQTCATKPLAASGCSALSPPPAVSPGGTISPPASPPPAYATYSEYDTAGNPVWTTTGDYAPGSNSPAQSRTTYELYSGESVTLSGTTDSCAAAPPSTALPCLTISPDGVVTQLGYDSTTGDLTSSSTPDGNPGGESATTTYTYNGDGQQATVVAPDGNVSGSNAAGYTTTSTYNADDQLHTQTVGTGAAARETIYGYDADGNQNSITDGRGYTTSKLYNANDQLTLVTDPDSQQTLTCYDGDGHISQTVPATGVAANSLTQASCPTSYPAGYGNRLAADATTYSYDALGDKTTITTPAPAGQSGSETTTNNYDLAGRLTTVTAPPASNDAGAPNQVTSYTYDADGRMFSTDQHGSPDSITSYCYDPNGNKTATVAPDGNTSGVASCSNSTPYQTSSPYQTGYTFDSLGEQLSKTTPTTSFVSSPTTSYAYDPAGNLLSSTDPAGVTTTNTYTPLNQLQAVSYSDSTPGVTYGYDANGNKVSMSDATGNSIYSYDPFNELQDYKNGAGKHVGYAYNQDGNLTSLTYPLGTGATWATSSSITYGYDNADELNAITDFNGTTSSLTNTRDGLPHVLSLGNTGDTLTTSYDPTDNPSDIKLASGTSTLQEFAYADTPSGTVNTETDTPASSQAPAGYDYNALGRVTQMTPGSGSPNNYGYDPTGNLTTLPTGATGSYDNASELTSSTQSGNTSNYTYNKDGERTQETAGGSTTVTATYNGAEELSSYSDPAANMTAATYDGTGLRQTATSTPAGGASITQKFTWDPSSALPRLLIDSNNAYIYARTGTPFEQVNLATGSAQYLVSDRLGSVRGIVDSTGALDGTTSYDAWGNPETSGGLTSFTPFGYAGYYTDPTGLTYNIARYYDPTTGQFFVVDPKVETTLQAYIYAADDPVTVTDPTGQKGAGNCAVDSDIARCKREVESHMVKACHSRVCQIIGAVLVGAATYGVGDLFEAAGAGVSEVLDGVSSENQVLAARTAGQLMENLAHVPHGSDLAELGAAVIKNGGLDALTAAARQELNDAVSGFGPHLPTNDWLAKIFGSPVGR